MRATYGVSIPGWFQPLVWAPRIPAQNTAQGVFTGRFSARDVCLGWIRAIKWHDFSQLAVSIRPQRLDRRDDPHRRQVLDQFGSRSVGEERERGGEFFAGELSGIDNP